VVGNLKAAIKLSSIMMPSLVPWSVHRGSPSTGLHDVPIGTPHAHLAVSFVWAVFVMGCLGAAFAHLRLPRSEGCQVRIGEGFALPWCAVPLSGSVVASTDRLLNVCPQ
jgi:hypothetical protein